ncbi:MAG: cytochrome c oxidase subunit II [Desulfuromonadales bacterium]|nr:cytochrome c oxidase subunit II [Desulfuromonadales bacterium]
MSLFGACLALLVGITVVMLVFVVRYHKSRAPQPTSQVEGSFWLEVVWVVLPSMLVLAMFYYGWAGYVTLRTVPKNALPVTATARMWSWDFTYANGRTSPKLYVPVGKPVVVELVSKDVIHGFYLPAFRVKRDVVPGMKNHVWFVADKPGTHDLFCSQYCGTGHSAMITTVEVLSEEAFENWLNQTPVKGVRHGRELMEKHGCLGCHSLDGAPAVGPTFKGLFGSRVRVLKDGKPLTVLADEVYLRESIRQPSASIVEGFPAIMPVAPDLSDADLEELVEYLEDLK